MSSRTILAATLLLAVAAAPSLAGDYLWDGLSASNTGIPGTAWSAAAASNVDVGAFWANSATRTTGVVPSSAHTPGDAAIFDFNKYNGPTTATNPIFISTAASFAPASIYYYSEGRASQDITPQALFIDKSMTLSTLAIYGYNGANSSGRDSGVGLLNIGFTPSTNGTTGALVLNADPTPMTLTLTGTTPIDVTGWSPYGIPVKSHWSLINFSSSGNLTINLTNSNIVFPTGYQYSNIDVSGYQLNGAFASTTNQENLQNSKNDDFVFANPTGAVTLRQQAWRGPTIPLRSNNLYVYPTQTWTCDSSAFITYYPRLGTGTVAAPDLVINAAANDGLGHSTGRLDNLAGLNIVSLNIDGGMQTKLIGQRLAGGTYGSLYLRAGGSGGRTTYLTLRDDVTFTSGAVELPTLTTVLVTPAVTWGGGTPSYVAGGTLANLYNSSLTNSAVGQPYGLILNTGYNTNYDHNNAATKFVDLDGNTLTLTKGLLLSDYMTPIYRYESGNLGYFLGLGGAPAAQILSTTPGGTLNIGGDLVLYSASCGGAFSEMFAPNTVTTAKPFAFFRNTATVNNSMGLTLSNATINLYGNYVSNLPHLAGNGLSTTTVNLVGGAAVKTFEVGDRDTVTWVGPDTCSLGAFNVGSTTGSVGHVQLVNNYVNDNPYTPGTPDTTYSDGGLAEGTYSYSPTNQMLGEQLVAGSVNVLNGTLDFNGQAVWAVNGFTVSAAVTNVANLNGGSLFVDYTGNLTVGATLLVNGGTITLGGDLEVVLGGAWDGDGSGAVSVAGDAFISGSFAADGTTTSVDGNLDVAAGGYLNVSGGALSLSGTVAVNSLSVEGLVKLGGGSIQLDGEATLSLTGTLNLAQVPGLGAGVPVPGFRQAGNLTNAWNALSAHVLDTNNPTVRFIPYYDSSSGLTSWQSMPAAGFTLTAVANPPGAGTFTCTPSQASYAFDAVVAISATANTGYFFGGWTVTGGLIANPSAASTSLTIVNNCALTANFLPVAAITVISPHGTVVVSPSQSTYHYGDVVTISATAASGYVLTGWYAANGTVALPGALTTTLTLSGAVTLTASYASGYYVNTLSPTASDSNVGSLALPLKTVTKALTLATAGQTVVVLQGVYRDTPLTAHSGTAANPITLKSNPGDRVVITGADQIPSFGGSWTQCTAVTASGNPNYANIYYTDLTWTGVLRGPSTLMQDEADLALAQTPFGSLPTLWPVTGGTPTTLRDTVHLTQSDANYWVGANLCYWDQSGATQYWQTITAYNPATATVTVAGPLSATPTVQPLTTGGDWYCIYNKVTLIGSPGQWAYQTVSQTASQYRIFVWPAGGGRPDGHLYEANRRGGPGWVGNLQVGGSCGYSIFDGLELRGSTNNGIYCGSSGHNSVKNCVVHHNDLNGINGRGNMNGLYLHNIMTMNGLWLGQLNAAEDGCGLTTGDGAITETGTVQTIQENEFSFNGDDAVFAGTSSCSFIGNYMHDHWQWEHTDNLQFCLGPNAAGNVLRNNLFMSSNDGTQSNTNSYTTYIGNTFIGMMSYPIQGEMLGNDLEHNTFLFCGWGSIGDLSVTKTLLNNLTVIGYRSGNMWTADNYTASGHTCLSDYNLFFYAPEYAPTTPVVTWNGNGGYSLAAYSLTSSQDANSVYGDPKFANAPYYFFELQFGKYNDFRANRVYFNSGMISELPYVAIGDYIEIGSDGVLRQITALNTIPGSEYVDFTPSDAKFLFKFCTTLVDWKGNPSTTRSLDLSLQAHSPAQGSAGDGGDMGASINVQDYMAGKLNGAATRVLPTWPVTPANLTQWAITATHSGAAVAATASEGQVESRKSPTGLALNFDYALSAATVNSAAVSIVDETGSSYSSRVAAVALDSTGKLLTISLSSPLPDQHWYTIAFNPTITATNGGPVRGTKSVRIGMLAGNVTGSGHVTIANVAALRSRLGQPVTPATARYDISGNGVITAADQRLIQSLVGHSLP